MPSAPEDKHELIEWFRGGGLLIITLSGILLYVIFAVPATIFYDRLGTTPSEVGLTYASLLGGSTLGALALLATVFILICYAASGIISAPVILFTSLSPFLLWGVRRQRRLISFNSSDQDFEKNLASAKAFYLSIAGLKKEKRTTWDQIEAAIRRMKELRQSGVLTAEQTAEYESQRALLGGMELTSLLANFPNFRFRSIFRIRNVAICVLIVVVALPVLAFVQAGYVRDGESYPGSQLGIFDYRAEPAAVSSSSINAPQGIAKLVDQQLFLLGQNAQYVILYLPKAKLTVRIPVAEVIVTSRLS